MKHGSGMPPATNGHGKLGVKRIRLVPNIKVDVSEPDRLVMLMLGEHEPELAAGMRPADARTLAHALIEHAEIIERMSPLIIQPGSDLSL